MLNITLLAEYEGNHVTEMHGFTGRSTASVQVKRFLRLEQVQNLFKIPMTIEHATT